MTSLPGALCMSVKSLLELARYGTTGVCSLGSLPLLPGWGGNLCFCVLLRVGTVSPILCLAGEPQCICSSFHVCGTRVCLGIRAVSCFIVFSCSSKVQSYKFEGFSGPYGPEGDVH